MLLLFTLVLVTAAVVHLLLLTKSGEWSWPERALAGTVGTVVLVQAEVQGLSLLPADRPLVALPYVHAALCLAGGTWAVRTTSWRAAAGALRPRWRATTTSVERVLACALAAVLVVVTAWGLVSGPTGVDELSYHVPQAALIHQAADLGRPDSYLPWTYAYPQGAAMLWGWTMFVTGDERAFHAVQALFGAQLALATYVLSRRSGAPRVAAQLAALALATAPVFFRMSTISTADMCFAAGTLTAVAFLAPRAGEASDSVRVAVLGLAQACSAKIPVLAVLLVGAAALHAAARWWRRRPDPALRWRRRPVLDLLVSVAALGSIGTYAVNAMEHANPFWPLALHVAGQDLPGPLATFTDNTIGAQTDFGIVAEMSRWELWRASLLDWNQPLTEDSLGAFGPAVALLGLPMLLICAVRAVHRRDGWLLTLLTVILIGFIAVPVLFVPRYGLPVVAAALALGAAGTRSLGRVPTAAVVVALVTCAVAVLPSARLVAAAAPWYAANAGVGNDWWTDRGRSVAENHRLNIPTTAQSPGLVTYVRTRVGAGDVVAYAITTYPTLLWNERFSNSIFYVPGSSSEDYPTGTHALPEPSDSELEAWETRLRALEPDHVIVYAASRYDDRLLAGGGWEASYQDPVSDGPTAAVVLTPREAAERRALR